MIATQFSSPLFGCWHSQVDGLEKLKIRPLADRGDMTLIDIKCHMQKVDKSN